MRKPEDDTSVEEARERQGRITSRLKNLLNQKLACSPVRVFLSPPSRLAVKAASARERERDRPGEKKKKTQEPPLRDPGKKEDERESQEREGRCGESRGERGVVG